MQMRVCVCIHTHTQSKGKPVAAIAIVIPTQLNWDDCAPHKYSKQNTPRTGAPQEGDQACLMGDGVGTHSAT